MYLGRDGGLGVCATVGTACKATDGDGPIDELGMSEEAGKGLIKFIYIYVSITLYLLGL